MPQAEIGTQVVECLLSPADLFSCFLDENKPVFLDSSAQYLDEDRYSILAFNPYLFLTGDAQSLQVDKPLVDQHETVAEDVLVQLENYLNIYRVDVENLPVPFAGGAIGYFAYGFCRQFEKIPQSNEPVKNGHDLQLGFYNEVIVYDHQQQNYHVFVTLFDDGVTGGESDIDVATTALANRVKNAKAQKSSTPLSLNEPSNLCDAQMQEHYLAAVTQTKTYIAAGDIYQANISEQIKFPLDGSPYAYYKRLRAINPSSFSSFLDFDDNIILSSSPERFLQVRAGHVQTRPIKGTRKRLSEDEAETVQQELMNSTKDRAELAMIVDVERNDLGRICQAGTVQVTADADLETLPTLYHLVATVEGELEEGLGPVEVLRAMFPSGSITGAPKIRAMEIIDELENYSRGVYTGAIGYISCTGAMDFNIAIRTIEVRNEHAYFSIGAGIVSDSVAASEYAEIQAKGSALYQSLTGQVL